MDCKNCEDKAVCVPFFVHENALMHYNRVNKRVLIAFASLFLAMCITVSFIIGVLVSNNTLREKQIIEMVTQHNTGVPDGIYEQQNP